MLGFREIIEYINRNYKWIIGTIIAVAIPMMIYLLQRNDAKSLNTNTYYYTNTNTDINETNLQKANCWSTSMNSNRSDSYRCSVDNSIYDPCFDVPFSISVIACPSEPYENNPEYFKIESRPRSDVKVDESPWYIILDNNQECGYLSGATTSIADRRLDYGCDKGDYDSLFLPIENDSGKQKIGCLKKNRIEACLIREVWY